MLVLRRIMPLLLLIALLTMSFGAVHAQDDCNFEEEPIRIGGIAPQSAPGSVIGGVSMSWAFNAAAQDINDECGIALDGLNYRVEIIVADSEGLPERGQAVAERLIFENEVVGMVGVFHSAVGLATMGVLQENQIPTVFSEPWNDNVTANGIQDYENQPARISTNDAGIDYIFRIAPYSTLVSTVVIDWLVALEVKDVVIIAENTDYGIPAAEKDKELLEASGATVEILFIEMGGEDFVPILSRIQARATPPDAVRLQVTGETSYNVTQQMAELGIAPTADTICVTNQIAVSSEQYWRNVPDGNYCAFNFQGAIPTLFNDIALDLNERYRNVFRDNIPSFAIASYDAVWVLALAIERAGTLDPAAIVAEIELSDVELAQGRYHFPYGGHNPELPEGVPAYMWHQWPDPAVTVLQYFEQGQDSFDSAIVWPPARQTHDTLYFTPGS